MRIVIKVEGATQEQLERGAKAAQDFFDAIGASAYDCAAAAFKQEGELAVLTPAEARLADAWDEAQLIAREACVGLSDGERRRVDDIELEGIGDPATTARAG